MIKELAIERVKADLFLSFEGIIQIGAFDVREYDRLCELGFKNFIFVDANPTVCEILKRRFSNSSHSVYNYAVTDKPDSEIELLILNHPQSSSVLKPLVHKQIYPEFSKLKGKLISPTITIDRLISDNDIDTNLYNFLMLDIQGAEGQALAGALKTLQRIDYIYTEVNYVEMFEGCMLEPDISSMLSSAGFCKIIEYDVGVGWGDAFYVKERLLP